MISYVTGFDKTMQASTHIQFYNFEGPQLHVGKCHHVQILISSFMKIWKHYINKVNSIMYMVKLQLFEVE